MQSPARCRALVQRLRREAHGALNSADWREAISFLGTACESIELLLERERIASADVNYYLQLSLELIYACRKSDYAIQTDVLIERVKRCLEPHYSLEDSHRMLKPLIDVSFSPLAEVDGWMQTIQAMNERSYRVLH
ncbi:hypothetical protein [Gilvimarinus xylanilyticus]|uniref:Uncharacterized protein n=1 Tax=Gilvimarinus xylanilyticus TaxID=2944139 RepID=A0A9X2HXR9_9GAMM|nr:hypothetical protein [Gilvimarinus xylanilyticus]MCP8898501.1 hypothetical protein [Gilvimarinus xylanilyticus]